MEHAPGFLKLVNEARPYVRELTPGQARERLDANSDAILIDVREDHEWARGRVRGAVHLGKGILERDLEGLVPDRGREILMYCGGGYRSILTAEAAKRMGYANVFSIAGGFKSLSAENWPMDSGS